MSLRASAYSLFLHAMVVFGAFIYCQSSESPRINSMEYLTVTAVNMVSENLATQTASASDDISPIVNPSEETPGKPVHQHTKKIQKSAPVKIIAGQRKIERRKEIIPDFKEADAEKEHKKVAVAPTVEPNDRGPQSSNLAGKKELASAKVSNGPGVTRYLMNGPQNIYLQTNYDYIRKIVARNISFPASARKRRLCGEIEVSFLVGMEGNVADIRIISSSGHALLDRNVVEAVRRSAPFPASPELARIVLPIVFRLK